MINKLPQTAPKCQTETKNVEESFLTYWQCCNYLCGKL